MQASLTDEETIRQFLSSQPNHCFETLYNRYVSKVYRRCLSMTKDSEKAEDFTHDIFLKAFGKLDAFQERSSFSTWLYSIAFNYCSDQLRIAKRVNVVPIDDTSKLDVADSQDSQLHEESLLLVRRAMKSLTPKEQDLLQLKYEDGMTIEQIAQLYDIKTSAVKMRLKRCREKIHRLYTQHENV